MYAYRQRKNVELGFTEKPKSVRGADKLIYVTGLEYIGVSNVARPEWHNGDKALYFYRNQNPGFGCGVSYLITGCSHLLMLGDMWNNDEFRKVFEQANDVKRGETYPMTVGTLILCVSNHQLTLPGAKETIEAWKKHYVYHEIGKFPNYNHKPANDMHMIALNICQKQKGRKENVKWEKPVDIAAEYVRDSMGRFASKQLSGTESVSEGN